MGFVGALFVFLLVVLIFIILPGLRTVRQYERGIVFRLGKYRNTLGPGLHVIVPYIDTLSRVDVRSTPIDVPQQ